MINHTNKFIFIHIPKCAGSSFEKAFKINPTKYDADILTGLPPGSDNHGWLQHCTLKQIELDFKIDIDDFYKFTCVRNPWSRVVSSYFYESKYMRKYDYMMSFEEFVRNPKYINNQHAGLQYEFILNSKNIPSMEFIMRQENLQEDFNIVCDNIKIDRKRLPRINRSTHKHYTEYYDDETRGLVAEKYAKDIEYFGYEFGD